MNNNRIQHMRRLVHKEARGHTLEADNLTKNSDRGLIHAGQGWFLNEMQLRRAQTTAGLMISGGRCVNGRGRQVSGNVPLEEYKKLEMWAAGDDCDIKSVLTCEKSNHLFWLRAHHPAWSPEPRLCPELKVWLRLFKPLTHTLSTRYPTTSAVCNVQSVLFITAGVH